MSLKQSVLRCTCYRSCLNTSSVLKIIINIIITSLCSASSHIWQRGTTRICCSMTAAWLLASCSNQSISDQYMGQMTDGWRDRRLVGWSLAPHSTQYKSFRRQSSQPITWLILTNKTVQENTDKQTQYKLEKVDNLKYSKTKLPQFSCLLQHSARKRGGLTVERPQAHTAGQRQTNTRQMRGPCYAGCDKKYCNVSGEIQGSVFNIQ